jgi:hypothetical protein
MMTNKRFGEFKRDCEYWYIKKFPHSKKRFHACKHDDNSYWSCGFLNCPFYRKELADIFNEDKEDA